MKMYTASIPVIFLLFILFFTSALSQVKKDEDLFTKASKSFFQKNFDMAEHLLKEVIQKDPQNALAYSYLGDIYLNKKQYDGALNLYLKAVEIDPAPAENYFRMGQIYYFRKHGALSIENYDKALARDSKLHIVYYHKGLAYLMLMRDKGNTISNWERFTTLVPEDPQYDSIKRIIALLKDPDFKIPEAGSEISIEEALLLGGATLSRQERSAENQKAGHETRKSVNELEEIYKEDDL